MVASLFSIIVLFISIAALIFAFSKKEEWVLAAACCVIISRALMLMSFQLNIFSDVFFLLGVLCALMSLSKKSKQLKAKKKRKKR